MSSLWGEFPFLKNTITRLKNDFNLFVIYGHNLALKEYFDALKITNLHYFSTYEEIWQLFGLSCVIVTKPGGLTIFEGMLKKKAFIFLHYIPGQEKANMAILEKYNLSKFVSTENDFLNAVYNFCSQADKLRNNYPFEVKDIRLKLTETINRLSPN
jgi:UDP-N-acetylglucosamine:LPS N-acetylglucosamine transferase